MAKDKAEGQDLATGPEPQDIEVSVKPIGPGVEEQKGQRPAGRQRTTDDSFTGRAAQFAVMAELMRQRCNAAVPEVDVGADVFAFRDDRAEVVRIQVKACLAPRPYKDGSGYSAKFGLPIKQLERLDDQPPLLRPRGGARGSVERFSHREPGQVAGIL